ncbi:MAG: homoserine O-succinyltransferase [Acidobacteria bacterium]|nr:MAG: homoserine O-succinyltransferase [Acidobacteriota bacterium]
MLQMVDEGRTPAHWAARNNHLPARSLAASSELEPPIQIALINNMPDPALEDTESQFFDLLEKAAGRFPVRVKLYSLPTIPRGGRGKQHLKNFYWDLDDLWGSRFDGVIITGTEPRQANLREEPYWPTMVDVFDWAEKHTASTVFSCLAAHAVVLHRDGISRHPLADKQFGIFDERRERDHLLTSGTSEHMRFPHSRWNELREDALISCGYSVLTKSKEAGVNLFVKMTKKSLFVHFQGHPEYSAGTLAKEYRRDVRRFLRQERQTYPSMPHGYFDATAARALSEFKEWALSRPHEGLMTKFPEAAVLDNGGENPWRTVAVRIYRNWLQYVVSERTARTACATAARTGSR